MSASSQANGRRSSVASSKVTNGKVLVEGVDQRSTWVRRLKDLIGLHLSDLGGEDNCSEAEKSIIRRASTLEVELERLEARFATSGEADASDLDLYQRTSNSMRRLLESVGLQRRQRDVTKSIDTFLREQQQESAA